MKESFNHVDDWLKEVDKHIQVEDTIRMLIANKSDLKKDIQVKPEDIRKFTQRTGIPVVETSAKMGACIEDAFSDITSRLINLRSTKESKKYPTGVKIEEPESKIITGCCV